MKKITKLFFAALIAMTATMMTSCEDSLEGEETSLLGNLKVQLVAPEGASHFDFSTVEVTISNVIDGAPKAIKANAEGEAIFNDLVAGSYNLTANSEKVTGSMTKIPVFSSKETKISVLLTKVNPSEGLVVKEVFYSGHSYYYDQASTTGFKEYFVEILNNSADTLYLDGLHIAEAWNQTAMDTETAAETPILQDNSLDHNFIYTHMVVKVPGKGHEHPLLPGKSFLLATNAINFKPEVKEMNEAMGGTASEEELAHIVDLSVADMETYAVDYLEAIGEKGEPDFDLDNPKVPNAENVYFETKEQKHFALQMSGSSIILFTPSAQLKTVKYNYKTLDETSERKIELMAVPVSDILDGCDFVYDAANSHWKRLVPSIDAGFGFVPDADMMGCMTNYSVRRKIDAAASQKAGRVILIDTNNSSNDFEAVEIPTPKTGYKGFDIR